MPPQLDGRIIKPEWTGACDEPRNPGSDLGAPMKREWLRAAVCAIGLSIYFFAVYNTCNAITARRTDVGHAGFAWERHIPFVPLMIVPYMSIDLFFFAAPFLCTSRRERRDHGRRILLAITIAGICFLLFPLTMTLSRPPPAGLFAPVFKFLYSLDHPYNLVPSLHIAQRTLLWVVYVSHTRGLLRAAVKTWFILIGMSTLMTYQHQVLDVLTGQFLGLFCLHAFPESSGELNRLRARSFKIAGRYGVGALGFVAAGYLLRPWSWLLLWPAFSLGLVGWAYLGAGPAIFRKRDGRLPLSTYIVFGPYLIGTRLAFMFHRTRDIPYSQVIPGLFIGRRVRDAESKELIQGGVSAVLDLTAECPEAGPFVRLTYLNVPMLDLMSPSAEQLMAAVAFIDSEMGNGGVYVHCAWGYSRSACVVAAYLLSAGEARTPEEAVSKVKLARPKVVIGNGLQSALRQFAGEAHGGRPAILAAPGL